MLNCFSVVVTAILRPEVSKGIKVDGLRDGEPLSIQFGTEALGNLFKIPVVETKVVGIGKPDGMTLIEEVSVRRSRYSPNLLEVIAPRPEDIWNRALLGVWMSIVWKTGASELVDGAVKLLELEYQFQSDHVREGLYVIANRGSVTIPISGKGLRYKFSYHRGRVVARVIRSSSAIEDDDEYELV